MSVIAIEHVSLDGVMQAPARPDEDSRGGFRHGGWSVPYVDQVMTETMAAGMANTSAGGALLLGRRTYADFASVWPQRTGNPVSEHLNKTTKYVASRTLREPLAWQNSILLTDAAVQVAELKRERDLAVIGSGDLLRSLLAGGLVDELLLTIHPLVLGEGQRLFPDSGPSVTLTLVESKPTTTGVIIARYRAG